MQLSTKNKQWLTQRRKAIVGRRLLQHRATITRSTLILIVRKRRWTVNLQRIDGFLGAMYGFNELNLRIEENGVPVGYLLHRTAAEAQRALWFEHEQRQNCRSESFHECTQELDDHRLSATQQQKNGWNVTQNRDVSGFGRFRPIPSNGFDKSSND